MRGNPRSPYTIAVLILLMPLAGCLESGETVSIPAPEPGFYWEYQTQFRSISFNHLGEGRILDHKGNETVVEVVRLQEIFYENPEGTDESHRRNMDLFVTPDLVNVLAYRRACDPNNADAAKCDGNLAVMTWMPGPAPWLFGASELWDSNQVWPRNTGERPPSVTMDVWAMKDNGDNITAVPKDQPIINRFTSAQEPYFLRGGLVFAPGEPMPKRIEATPRTENAATIDYELIRHESRPLHGGFEHYDGVALDDELPRPYENTGTVPMERSRDYMMFPLGEALEVLKEEGHIPEDDLFIFWAGGAPTGVMFINRPGPSLPGLPDRIDIDASFKWRMTVGTPDDGADYFEITKNHRNFSENSYDIERSTAHDFLEDFTRPTHQIYLDDGLELAKRLYPEDSFFSFWITHATSSHEHKAKGNAYVYTFAPSGIDPETESFAHYTLVLEADTGHLLHALNHPDRINDTFLLQFPSSG